MIYTRLLPSDCYSASVMPSIDLLVIHSINAGRDHPDDPYNMEHIWRLLRTLKLSAHYLIGRNGIAWRMVPDNRVAWHVGRSSWRGRSGCNGFSIGIELAGGMGGAYTAAQYATLGLIAAKTVSKHGLEVGDPRNGTGQVAGHKHVSPGRKVDPVDPFDWDGFLANLNYVEPINYLGSD